MPRTLYIIDGSPPARAAWMACEAAGLEVQVHKMDFIEKREQFEDWFLKLNPKHCVPTLDDDGFRLWESRAVMRYVANAYSSSDQLYPKDPKRRAEVDRVLDYDLGTLYKTVGLVTFPDVFLYKGRQNASGLHAELGYLDENSPLAEGIFVTGEHMTIADISMISSLTFLETVDFDFNKYPNVLTWMNKMKAQPFYAICNAGFEEWKEEIKTLEWKRKNEARMEAAGKKVAKSVG